MRYRYRRNRRRIFSNARRNIFNYRYIKRNIAVVASVVGTVAVIGLVVKYGEMADYTAEYQNSQAVEVSYTEMAFMDASSIDTVVDAVQNNTATKLENDNSLLTEAAEEESEFDGMFIANIDDTLNVRAEASIDSDIVGKLFDGNVGEILGTSGEWVNISSGDVTGYVNSEYILTGKDAEEYAADYKKVYGTVTDETVNVRSSNSTASDILELAAEGEVYNVVEASSDAEWVAVLMASGDVGYISADYITVEEAYEYAMTIEDYVAMCEAESQPEDTEYAENDSEVQVMSTDYTDSSSESDSSSTSDSSSSSDSQTVEAAVTEQPAATTTDSSSSETQDTSSDAGQYSDAYLLACLVSMEAGYESYEGQLAVANVVLNRVNSGKWGSSISSVIYAPNQFPCATGSVMQGYLQNGPLSTAQQAANDALAGNNNIGSFMSFLNVNYIDTDSLSDYQIIGNHCFY